MFEQICGGAGEGLTKVRWVPNRGLLLLMQLNQLSVYCIESKSTLTRMSLPAKYAPFSKWLAVQGTGTCLGTGDDGGANTLVCEHEVCPCCYDYMNDVIPTTD